MLHAVMAENSERANGGWQANSIVRERWDTVYRIIDNVAIRFFFR
jgi:hypothetical protein